MDASEGPNVAATARDVRRATWIILAAIVVATILIIISVRNGSPYLKCPDLSRQMAEEQPSAEVEEEYYQMGCDRI